MASGPEITVRRARVRDSGTIAAFVNRALARPAAVDEQAVIERFGSVGFLLAERPNWTAAVIFYLLFVAGMVVFAISPAIQRASLLHAVLLGGFFGLVTYATYDLTNLATLRDWPIFLTAVDIVWGTFLATSVATVGYLVGNWML